MPTYKAPGVYVEEVDRGVKPLEAAGTAVAAFIGFTERIPKAQRDEKPRKIGLSPRKITSWTEYLRLYGGLVDDAFLPEAVNGYFANGGTKCYIVPVPHLEETGAEGTITRADLEILNPDANADAKPPAALVGEEEGDEEGDEDRDEPTGPRTLVRIEATTTNSDAAPLDIVIKPIPPEPKALEPAPQADTEGEGETGESDADTDTDAESTDDSTTPSDEQHYIVKVRRGGAVIFADSMPVSQVKSRLETDAKLKDNGIKVHLVHMVGGTASPLDQLDGNSQIALVEDGTFPLKEVRNLKDMKELGPQFAGDPLTKTGLAGLDSLEDVTIVMAPDAVQLPPDAMLDVQNKLIGHCERHKDRLAILDPPEDAKRPDQVLKWRQQKAMYDSQFAALYYPWLQVYKPSGRVSVPPSGHMAGVWARTDGTIGPWKAPANATVSGIVGLDYRTTTVEQEDLNPEGINVVRAFGSEGIRVWGARTLSSDTSWKYINVRRLFNMVEKTIKDGTSWVVFEPNDPTTWGRVWGTLDGFLRGLWRQGAFFGTSPADAYFIKVDSETNPPDVINRGELVVEVGIAPVKPAEFVIFRVSQKPAELV